MKIANGSAFWGDSLQASKHLLEQQPDLDFLTLDYLAEFSLSIMAAQKEKDPMLGYAKDFLVVIRSLIPFWKKGLPFKVVANAGGLYPKGCAEACRKILQEEGCEKAIAFVDGDDVLSILKQNECDPLYNHMETKAPLSQVSNRLVAANAYLGAKSIVAALKEGADIVITGRVADPSLTVGPACFHFNWPFDHYDLLAQATVAGHLIECGTQVTGGISCLWEQIEDVANLGFPFVEIEENGAFTITKPRHTGGVVNEQTVKEQLLYEIDDPSRYYSPDVIVSFLNVQLEEKGVNQIYITGAKGSEPTPNFKVSASYKDGFKAEGSLVIIGDHAVHKGRLCGNMIINRTKPKKSLVECIGAGDVVPGVFSRKDAKEIVLRVAAADEKIEVLEQFVKEFAPLVTSGPPGVTGYTTGRPHIRPVFGFWPCLIEKKHIFEKWEML